MSISSANLATGATSRSHKLSVSSSQASTLSAELAASRAWKMY
ncbi:hypothetical protein PF005_g16317 [Phytophthora fragariae]|uniref:Uncharacterized protein n=2 Tax=Phytophthora TaxID=4783 RepID=A0A6A4D414_9STRA|nr:hypothetical protein PF003_g35258 [Phytophthora fragariae]KAE8998205.1 hypothetical protein PR002_g18806 [Phytophthora rubi]KAE8932241.1 hypothetical protein PF009_g17717 [Phytophthora fragariae]KAE9097542.1 hypothetical protein PF010_g15919 [Phytophthora fragariae]KAE9134403.1 hypothetical protein PF006_g14828 [Phytophthora fragariae]